MVLFPAAASGLFRAHDPTFKSNTIDPAYPPRANKASVCLIDRGDATQDGRKAPGDLAL